MQYTAQLGKSLAGGVSSQVFVSSTINFVTRQTCKDILTNTCMRAATHLNCKLSVATA